MDGIIDVAVRVFVIAVIDVVVEEIVDVKN